MASVKKKIKKNMRAGLKLIVENIFQIFIYYTN